MRRFWRGLGSSDFAAGQKWKERKVEVCITTVFGICFNAWTRNLGAVRK